MYIKRSNLSSPRSRPASLSYSAFPDCLEDNLSDLRTTYVTSFVETTDHEKGACPPVGLAFHPFMETEKVELSFYHRGTLCAITIVIEPYSCPLFQLLKNLECVFHQMWIPLCRAIAHYLAFRFPLVISEWSLPAIQSALIAVSLVCLS